MKRIIVFFVVLGIVASVQLAFAQPRDFDSSPMFRMEKMLDLNDEQKATIEDLHLTFQKETLQLRSRIHELRTNLKLELVKDNYDQKKVDQTLDQMESIRKEMQKKRVSHLRAVRNTLNDDQKKKFDMHILSGHQFRGDRGAYHQRSPQPQMKGRGRF